jgi:predicted phosphate transport protein (TIGR00153 family)
MKVFGSAGRSLGATVDLEPFGATHVGFRLTPQDAGFYDLFSQSAGHLVEGAAELTAILGAQNQAERETIANRLSDIETSADEATHELIRKVNSSFITPFDREDIHGLASALDDCIDHMEAAGDLVALYRIADLGPGVAKQVEILSRMAEVTVEAMPRLRSMKDLSSFWIEINRLENSADKAYRRMLAELFNAEGADPIDVMKRKELIDQLEAAADAFENVAHKVESIAVKES